MAADRARLLLVFLVRFPQASDHARVSPLLVAAGVGAVRNTPARASADMWQKIMRLRALGPARAGSCCRRVRRTRPGVLDGQSGGGGCPAPPAAAVGVESLRGVVSHRPVRCWRPVRALPVATSNVIPEGSSISLGPPAQAGRQGLPCQLSGRIKIPHRVRNATDAGLRLSESTARKPLWRSGSRRAAMTRVCGGAANVPFPLGAQAETVCNRGYRAAQVSAWLTAVRESIPRTTGTAAWRPSSQLAAVLRWRICSR